MFDLRAWQQQVESNLATDAEKAQIWQQMKPLMEELAPLIENVQQKVEQRVQSQLQMKPREIVCFASTPASRPASFFPMLRQDMRQRLLMREEKADVTAALFKQLKRPHLPNQSCHLWLHGGICYGDAQLLQQQTVQVTFYQGAEQLTVRGKYVHAGEAQRQIAKLTEQAKRVGVAIPFVPDYYAQRFYLLQLDVADCAALEKWSRIERIDVQPFAPDIAEQVQMKRYEEPIWNVETVSLRYCRNSKRSVANGLFQRKFEYVEQPEQTLEATPIIPIVPLHGVFESLRALPEENRFIVSVELPIEENLLEAYVIWPVELEQSLLHNQAQDVLQFFAKEPSIADFHRIVANYTYFSPLQMSHAQLELLPAQTGDLWRRDCLVLYVKGERDAYTASRLHALEQCMLHYFAYAACRIEWVGDGDGQ